MTEDNGRFCTRCGASIPQGSSFCPECGSPIDGGVNPHMNQGRYSPVNDPMDANWMFILVYGILATVYGLMMLGIPSAIDQAMWDEIISQYGDIFAGMTYEAVMSSMYLGACFAIPSGVAAIISGYLCRIRSMWIVTIVLCALASVLAFGYGGVLLGTILFLVGMLMTYRVYRSKQYFKS